jgi:hypothetical protein
VSSIGVIGAGYVGLTTAAVLAHLGHQVCCADVIPAKVERLSRGEVPILEDGLEDMVREGLKTDRLSFVLGAANAAVGREFVFLCVPTPQDADGSAEMSYVVGAASEIGPVLRSGAIVINKSTVPVGSTLVVERALGREWRWYRIPSSCAKAWPCRTAFPSRQPPPRGRLAPDRARAPFAGRATQILGHITPGVPDEAVRRSPKLAGAMHWTHLGDALTHLSGFDDQSQRSRPRVFALRRKVPDWACGPGGPFRSVCSAAP